MNTSPSNDLHSKSRNELREALRKKGLSPSGVKEDLIRRLESLSPQSAAAAIGSMPVSSFHRDSDSRRSTDDEQPSPQHTEPAQITGHKREREIDQETDQLLQDVFATHSASTTFVPSVPYVVSKPISSHTTDEVPVCGQPNKYGKPCQRVGRYCPYHGVIKAGAEAHSATKTHRESSSRVQEPEVYLPASVSALPSALDYSTSLLAHRRRVDNYDQIVNELTHRPTKRFKYVEMTPEELAKQRFFQHAALEFERIREEQQHQLEFRLLQQQVAAMREKSRQKDRVIEQLEQCISEMDQALLTQPDRIPSDTLHRWRQTTQRLHLEHDSNLL